MRKALRDEQIKKHRNLILADNDEDEDFNPAYEMTIADIKEGKISRDVKFYVIPLYNMLTYYLVNIFSIIDN